MTTAAPGHFVNHIEPDYFGKLICKRCSGYGWSHGYYYGGWLDWVDCGTCKGNGHFSLVTYMLLCDDLNEESGKMIPVPCMNDTEGAAHCPHCHGSCYFDKIDKRGNPSRGRGTIACSVCEGYGTVRYVMGYPSDRHNTVAAWVGMKLSQEQLDVFRRLLNEGYSIAVWEGDFSGALYLGDVGNMAALMQAINTELWLSDRVPCSGVRVRNRCDRGRRAGGKVRGNELLAG